MDKRDMHLNAALWALRRIDRKQAGLTHSHDKTQTCDCCQCIARDALERIKQLEVESLTK